MPEGPLAEDGMTTTTVLDGCSMSKGIERLGGDQEQQCVALAGRSEEQAWLDGDQWQLCPLAGRCGRSDEQAWLGGDHWQQGVALAGQSEQQGWR